MKKYTNFLIFCNNFLRKKYNSNQTQKCYLHEIELFIEDINKDIHQLNNNDIQLYLDKHINSSRSKQNQVIAALKCLYISILKRKNFKYKFIRAKKIEYLPTLLSKEEMKIKLDNINNLKHKSIYSLLYGCGLRLNEIINLKITDINGRTKLLKVVQGKGNKDRFIPISENLLILLRKYFLKYHPKEYLFNGQGINQNYSGGSIGKIVKKYFGSTFHPHLLRHQYGTHLCESKVELSKIQKLMGHNNIKSTQIYTKTANNLQDIPQLI